MALLGICDVFQNCGQDARHLGIYSKLKFIETMQKLKIFFARVKNMV